MIWLSVILVLLAMAFYGALHSWMAAVRFKRWLAKHFPRFYTRYYRLFYSFFSVVSLLPILLMVWLLPNRSLYQIPTPWIYFTLLIQVAAVVLMLVALLQTNIWVFLGVQQALGSQPRREAFHAEGMYRLVRHPLYTLGMIFLWLQPVMSLNLLALVIASTIYLVIGARLEERKLLKQFPEYATYRRSVPMFIPGLLHK